MRIRNIWKEKDNLILVLTVGATVLLLFWRFQLSMSRIFDVDEFAHMFRAYLLADGQVPYKDFGYFYSPLFAGLFAPFFFFFKENLAAIFLSRSLEFVIFASTVLVFGLIGWTISGRRMGVTAAFLLAFLPLGLDKTIEIRPDNLSILFWLLSIFCLLLVEKKRGWEERLTALAGVFFGLSVVVIIKLGFAYPGLLVFLMLRKKSWRPFFLFHLGAAVPVVFLGLILASLGALKPAIYQILLMPLEISQAYGKKYFVPFFPFLPNDTFYGLGGRSLPWFLSNLVLVLGLVGLFKSRLRVFWLTSLAFLVIAVFFVYKVTLVQYYLPFLFLLVLGAAEILRRLPFFAGSWLLVMALLTLGFWQSIQAHLHWTNDRQLSEIHQIWSISQPGDHFFDMTGYHLFRPSGYFWCCELFPDWMDKLSQPLPQFQREIKINQTTFIVQTDRLGLLSGEDQRFIFENFSRLGNFKILLAK